MDDDQEAGVRTCVACSIMAPTAASEYTLVGQKYGWRCKRAMDDRSATIVWYCPACWTVEADAAVALKYAEAGARSERPGPSTPPMRSSAFPQSYKRK